MVLDAQPVEVLSVAGRILVIQTAFPGDSVLALPFIQEVRRMHPGHEIDVVCSPVSQEIFSHSPAVSVVHPLEKRGEHKGLGGMLRFASRLKEEEYGKVFSLHRSFRTTMLVNLISAGESTGFDTASMAFLYDRRVAYEHREHEVKRNLNLLGGYEGESWKIMPEVVTTPGQKAKVDDFFRAIGVDAPLIVISPGSVWETKRYPLKSYAEVAFSLTASGYRVVISGSQTEKEMGEEIVRVAGDRVVNTCGVFSIVETIELMRRVALVVTNDSAPTHFAMAAGAPVLTIYCSTVPEFGFHGYSDESFYLSKGADCKPCGVHGHKKCPNGSFECGTGIHPYEVVNKIIEIMKRK